MLPTQPAHPARRGLSRLAVMILTPLFFSSNLIFGRSTIPEVAPFTLAFLRWTAASLALAPFVWLARDHVRTYVSSSPRHWLLLGFLGMWICGAGVYYALQFTTATNGTLIYTTSPLMVICSKDCFSAAPPAGVNWQASRSAFSAWRSSCSRAIWTALPGSIQPR
jgi:hypothetical protein